MTPLQETIVQVVEANNGSCPYGTIVDSVEYPQRQKVFASIRDLQSQGVLKREVALDPDTGKSTLTISKVV